ncbi:uncharacterized protein LOC131399246 [Diceros bicornis minor]|uniref:uncharacterized protein LOC131399246 n=1 Tax=Diceros bicornis minor TaxID=77932 RepID=UPI0026EC24EC|nr:uncharacterized protein LOC131399246 [Diceros bicornis minor]
MSGADWPAPPSPSSSLFPSLGPQPRSCGERQRVGAAEPFPRVEPGAGAVPGSTPDLPGLRRGELRAQITVIGPRDRGGWRRSQSGAEHNSVDLHSGLEVAKSLRLLTTSPRGGPCDIGERTHLTDHRALSPFPKEEPERRPVPDPRNAQRRSPRPRALPGVGARGGRAGPWPSALRIGGQGAGPATQPQRLGPAGGRQEGRRRPLERGRNPAGPACPARRVARAPEVMKAAAESGSRRSRCPFKGEP